MDVSLLLARYEEVARANEGRWFALSREGELLAVSSSERRLWSKIRRRLSGKDIDVVIGYSQTAKERKTACLLVGAQAFFAPPSEYALISHHFQI